MILAGFVEILEGPVPVAQRAEQQCLRGGAGHVEPAAPGVELSGPFRAELQNDLVFVGAVAAETKNAEAARALLDFLKCI